LSIEDYLKRIVIQFDGSFKVGGIMLRHAEELFIVRVRCCVTLFRILGSDITYYDWQFFFCLPHHTNLRMARDL
jgi:hypothetical protein